MIPEKTELESLKKKIAELEAEVSECLEVKETLKDSEEKFRNFFNLSSDAIFIHDLEGRIIEANQKAESLFGYSDAEVKNLRISALHPEDAIEKSRQALKQLMHDRFIRFEIDFRIKNGKVFPAEVSSSIFMSGGRQYIQKIIRNISNRKQAEKALRDSESKLRAMLDASPLAIALLGRDGRILDTNAEHAHRYKMSRDEMLGKCLWDLLPPSVLSHRRQQIENVFDTGTPFSGEDVREGIWNEHHVYPAIRNEAGDIHAVIIEAMNITERKHAEAALAESESRYKSLFNNNHAIMLIIDSEDGKILDANPAAVSYYGWSHEEIIRKKISDINMLGEQEVIKEMAKAKKELRRIFHFRHRLAGGDIRDVEVYSGPIPIGGRDLLFSIIHDVTDRKKAEEERSELIRELQTALKEIKTLRGILPICASCKKIRDDQGYWNQLENYIYEHSEAQFSHGLCPDCTRELYPEVYARIQSKKKQVLDE